LPADELVAFEKHLDECAPCRAVLAQLEVERAGAAGTPPEAAQGDTRAMLPPGAETAQKQGAATQPAPTSAMSLPLPAGQRLYEFLEPAAEKDEIGRLGSYRILRLLGAGGMGMVFEAEDLGLQRRVALKLLRPEMAADLQNRERFLREARAAAGVPHDHIVTIYQVGQVNDVPFLAMQYLEGRNLENHLVEVEKLELSEVLRVAREIAEGLAAAHAHGLIHRDIKPSNIWLERPAGEPGVASSCGRVKILDFGLARRDSGVSRLTETGMIVGTPGYMSPEQARSLPLDHRSDIFSLGCVLYWMLTGAIPFDGENTLAVLSALALDPPRPVEELNAEVPLPLAALIHQMLEKNPANRPTSARAVADYLHALEQGRSPEQPPPSLPPRASASKQGPPSGRRRTLVLGGAAAVALLALLLTFWPKRTAGPAIAPAVGGTLKVGILHSLTGTMRNSESPVVEATLMALDEVNQQGGVLGRKLEPIVADGESNSQRFAAEAERLISDEKVAAIFGCWTSAARKTVRPVVEKHNHLLIYPIQYEGLEDSPNILYTGAVPNQQIMPAVQYAAGILRKRRLFLVGSDYVFPRSANYIIRGELSKFPEVTIVGEHYLPLGSVDAENAVQEIVASKADLILNTINGDSNVAFFRELRQAGITPDKVPTISFSIAENELRNLDPRQMAGDYAAWSYFHNVDTPENAVFVKSFQARFGPQRRTSGPQQTAYFSVHLWAQAANAAGSTEAAAVRQAIKGRSFKAPEGTVQVDAENLHTWKTLRLGQITEEGRFKILWMAGEPIRPVPFPACRTRADWDAFLLKLYEGWGGRWEKPRS
jgi:urea transport system substrate-binding protein